MVIGRVLVGLRALPLQYTRRMASTTALSPNLTLYATSSLSVKKNNGTWVVETPGTRPLVLLFEYMNAKKKHVDKFVEFYKEKRFDVLTVNLKPWQLFWPVKGSQVLAKEITSFLVANERFEPIVYHGFSVGGYLWGEVLKYCEDHREETSPMLSRVKAQIMDSGVDVTEIPTAFPSAVVPNKPFFKAALEKFIRYQMETFYNESTRHYVAARKAFTAGLVRGPTLLIYSDADPFSPPRVNEIVVKDMAEVNLPCETKEFSGSKHVMHYQKHKVDYLKCIADFLSDIEKFEDKPEDTKTQPDRILQSRL